MNYNKTYLLGRLAHTPELKALPSGGKVASMSLATNRTWKNEKGEKVEATDWHNLIAFGKMAENLAQYCEGGQAMFFVGRMQTRSWDGEDGKKRYKTEMIIEEFQFGPKSQAREERKANNQENPHKEPEVQIGGGYDGPLNYPEDEINPDDIPF